MYFGCYCISLTLLCENKQNVIIRPLPQNTDRGVYISREITETKWELIITHMKFVFSLWFSKLNQIFCPVNFGRHNKRNKHWILWRLHLAINTKHLFWSLRAESCKLLWCGDWNTLVAWVHNRCATGFKMDMWPLKQMWGLLYSVVVSHTGNPSSRPSLCNCRPHCMCRKWEMVSECIAL